MKRPFSLLLLAILLTLLGTYKSHTPPVRALPPATPRVNLFFTTADEGSIPTTERAIFWFGEVGPTDKNYTDVRAIYNEDKLHITLHVFDRLIWYDTTPTPAELTDWDAATLYLNLDGNVGTTPSTNSYQFVAAYDYPNDEPRDEYQAVYQGDGSDWVAASTVFTTEDGREGEGINDYQEDKGWNMTFRIPFSSLGLSGPPPEGTVWGLAVAVHDRDDEIGLPIPDQQWPQTLNSDVPGTWGQMAFGLPEYVPPTTEPTELVTIKHGVNGVVVEDGHIGGATNCAMPYYPNYWQLWGGLNYSGDPNANIQNQWNLGDFACFSKYFATFPLDSLPPNQAVISAELTMYHFGNSLPDLAQPSFIQVFTVEDEWDEATLTWNNAPRAVENIARSWVEPLPGGTSVNIPIEWDISAAVAEAYASGQPLRLAVYSADNARHSGKYFRSSNANEPVRPFLTIQLGNADGFLVETDVVLQTADPGAATTFQLTVTPTGNFNSPVTITADNPAPSTLDIEINPSTLNTLPGQTTITLTDLHNPNFTGSQLYTVPITLSGDGIERTVNLYLLINGSQLYLPVVMN